MKKPEIAKLQPEILAYIEYLEGCLNGSSELIQALNTASKVFSDDLNMLCSGEAYEWVTDVIEDGETEGKDKLKSNLVFLSGDAKDKTFERIMVLFDKFDKIKALSQHFKSVTAPQSDNRKIKLKPGGNVYEHVLDQVKNGRSRV